MPLFSVIIPTFNRRELLEKALESVWRQRFTDYEVIVVDDGSTDGTDVWMETLRSRVRYFRQPNRGPGSSRNLGASHAQGDYLAFLDSDDLWFPWTLACFAELIQRHGNPAILASKELSFVDADTLAGIEEAALQALVFQDYFASHQAGCYVGAGLSVLDRKALLHTGGYTDKNVNSEDHDLILRMGDARGFVQIISPVTVGWRRHSGSASRDMMRSVAGSLYLVAQELRGAYPGGFARRIERIDILTRHVRPVVLACIREDMKTDAWRLYTATFRWHLRLGRWKFLFGFPWHALIHRSRTRTAYPEPVQR